MITGKIISLVPASLDDKRRVYEWCFHSETTKSHSGPPDYPELKIPTYEEFCENYYEDYFFTGSQPADGRGFLIIYDGMPIGFISYCAFHLKQGISELDNWIFSEENCGKGCGTDAIITLGNYLHEKMSINTLIMGPSVKNLRAIRAYEKAGLKKTNRKMSEFLLDEYIPIYGNGDYGVDQTAVCVKQFDSELQ